MKKIKKQSTGFYHFASTIDSMSDASLRRIAAFKSCQVVANSVRTLMESESLSAIITRLAWAVL
ncbi:hypothetical protein [Pantoea sp.]|uniref:hypothetical protein n=1 Tax=Pantoea sp. TaxID=69393 RepID=UPI0028A6EA98|nr:hypothetical protein [Pantoea sp.]